MTLRIACEKQVYGLSAIVLAIALVAVWAPRAEAQPDLVTLPHHTLPALPRLAAEGRADRSRVLDLVVGLSLRNEPTLDAILDAQHDPSSPWFHRWLTPNEFAAWFAPTAQDHDQVVRWLRSRGLTVTALATPFDSTGAATGYGSETAWSGSGGGTSLVFGKPGYQTGVTPNDATRDVPDVSLEAGPSPGNLLVYNGTTYRAWGTSLAAPQWAGLFAIINQRKGGTGVGNANSRLYSLGLTANGFHDVTAGNNTNGATAGFTAGTGYDQVTGWGSYNAYQLAIGY